MVKKEFILNEIWMLTIGASFQRANVYIAVSDSSDKVKFRNGLKELIINLSKIYISESVSESQHVTNIYSIIEYSKNYNTMLTHGQLNFGICQKLLNLYLKYLWCLGYLKATPPHFPVDRIIQLKLNIKNPYPWTQMMDEIEYMKVINLAKVCLESHHKENLAELELYLFQRR